MDVAKIEGEPISFVSGFQACEESGSGNILEGCSNGAYKGVLSAFKEDILREVHEATLESEGAVGEAAF
jgi:hypothetical protein